MKAAERNLPPRSDPPRLSLDLPNVLAEAIERGRARKGGVVASSPTGDSLIWRRIMKPDVPRRDRELRPRALAISSYAIRMRVPVTRSTAIDGACVSKAPKAWDV